MQPDLTEKSFSTSLAARLASTRPAHGVSLYWLGQAGFILDNGGVRILIDPYLSDSLAVKYRDRGFSHERMMPPPVTVDTLPSIDFVLCTHHHTDHMDGETLQAIAARFPDTRFLVPVASLELAEAKAGLARDRVTGIDAGEIVRLGPGLTVTGLRAAHETLERDAAGHYVFLGYGLDIAGVRIFHSGDSIPFEGQIEEIGGFSPDIALLPVNGRSLALKTAGIVGNFDLDEAVALAGACGIPRVIAHHYGMFAFNTVPPDAIDAKAVQARGVTDLRRARAGVEYQVASGG